MTAAADNAERLLERARRGLDRLLPAGAVIGDAHTHLGLDEDGMTLDLATALANMEANGVSRALVFPLHEADRSPSYRAPNDRVLGWAGRSGGRLVPLARLDLNEDPIGEARRCIALGARGIKLHPRAQRFDVHDDRLEPVFALAEEHRLPVLIHAGRGMPPIGEHLAAVSARHPGAILILAHAAIVDQERICNLVAGMPNVFFDTSTWSVIDLVGLLARVPPEQVLWATDVPYGHHQPPLITLAALLEEFGASERVRRGIFGESLEGILRGELPTLTAPIAPSALTVDNARLRIAMYLTAAVPMLWRGQRDHIGLAGLASGACLDTDGELAALHEIVSCGERLWAELPDEPTRAHITPIYRLFMLAQIACFAPGATRRTVLCD
jgi:predicted TIM-barrel fold metal-dependent hydrolase